jgi:LPXTG-motif cell wall-anchored protein
VAVENSVSGAGGGTVASPSASDEVSDVSAADTSDTGDLPETGSDTLPFILLAFGLFLLGAALAVKAHSWSAAKH